MFIFFIFPAKKLIKNTGAQNTHAPFFLLKNKVNNQNQLLEYLLSNNNIKRNIQVCCVFYC